MRYNLKSIASKIFFVFIILSTITIVYEYCSITSHHAIISRNKMIQSDFILHTLNESNYDLDALKKKWGKLLIKQSSETYLLSKDIIFHDSYFKDNGYVFGQSDFFGYELQFDNRGKIALCNPYMP
jgi:hypothetical protein